jgi:hypothetical protein
MKIVLLLFVVMLSSCGGLSRFYTRWTGNLTYKCSKAGVEYVQADSGLAVHLDVNGKPIACKE